MRAKAAVWVVLGVALLIGARTTADRYHRIGQPFAGFLVMENLLVGVAGAERGGLQPFDLVRAVHGRVVDSAREIQAEIAKFPPGTPIGYVLNRRGELIEADVVTRLTTPRDFQRFLLEGLLPSLLFLALGAFVFHLKPGHSQSWVFLAFCVGWYLTNVTYIDAHTTYRFTAVFLISFALSPALLIHLGLTFPQRRTIAYATATGKRASRRHSSLRYGTGLRKIASIAVPRTGGR